MQKEKEIWTLNKTCYDEYGDITYRSERAYEMLSDALKHIGVWSNMKTNCEGLKVTIDNDGVREDETTFVAKTTGDRVYTEEEMILQKVTLKLKDNGEDS